MHSYYSLAMGNAGQGLPDLPIELAQKKKIENTNGGGNMPYEGLLGSAPTVEPPGSVLFVLSIVAIVGIGCTIWILGMLLASKEKKR